MDDQELQRHRQLEFWKFKLAHVSDLFRATSAFEHIALRPLILLNGGALVVLLAFLGTIWDANAGVKGLDAALVWWAAGVWALGLFLAASAAAAGYFSQFAFYKAGSRDLDATIYRYDGKDDQAVQEKERHDEFAQSARSRRCLAYGLGGVSLACFLGGLLLALLAII